MFQLYRILIGIFFYLSLPFSLVYVWITGKHRKGLFQRFAFYPGKNDTSQTNTTVWLHAASVGEVQAARAIIPEIRKQLGDPAIILTTMTLAGKKVAEGVIEPQIRCYLAPLDIPGIVDLAIARIQPDLYICLETELWPVLIMALSRRNIFIGMVNGRISSRSFTKYQKLGSFISSVLLQFDRMAVISETDRDKYISLGASADSLSVEGNVKYDMSPRKNAEEIVERYSGILSLSTEEVFIAGSTHDDEEEQLLELHIRHFCTAKMLFLLAPRHIDRIDILEKMMKEHNIGYHLFSLLKNGTQDRKYSMVLVDTMGDLADLYGIADYIFCGGSLVKRGGHNLMEAAVWDKAVFYGPFIDDFHDAADLLKSVQGGFMVANIADIESQIRYFRNHRQHYIEACQSAGEIARAQQGSSSRQVSYILKGFRERE